MYGSDSTTGRGGAVTCAQESSSVKTKKGHIPNNILIVYKYNQTWFYLCYEFLMVTRHTHPPLCAQKNDATEKKA